MIYHNFECYTDLEVIVSRSVTLFVVHHEYDGAHGDDEIDQVLIRNSLIVRGFVLVWMMDAGVFYCFAVYFIQCMLASSWPASCEDHVDYFVAQLFAFTMAG